MERPLAGAPEMGSVRESVADRPAASPPFWRTCAKIVLNALTTLAAGTRFWISSAALVV